jgi:hypothetical protein
VRNSFSKDSGAIQENVPLPEGVLLQDSMARVEKKYQNTELSFVKNRRQNAFMAFWRASSAKHLKKLKV